MKNFYYVLIFVVHNIGALSLSPAPWSHPPPDGKLILEKGSEEGNKIVYALSYVHINLHGFNVVF